jgi:hypothetical protein
MSLTPEDLQNIGAIVASSAQSVTTKLQGCITEAIGMVNKRVDAVELSVSSIQNEVAAMRDRMDTLTGTDTQHYSNNVIDILPSIMAIERATFASTLIIDGLKQVPIDLNAFISSMLAVLCITNVEVVSASYTGRIRDGQARLVKLEVKTPDQAMSILKCKKKLRDAQEWSHIFINQMRSRMVGGMQNRMSYFFRHNKDKIDMKMYHDCVVFTESAIRVPLYQFSADKISVGPIQYEVISKSASPVSRPIILSENPIQQLANVNTNPKPVNQPKPSTSVKADINKPKGSRVRSHRSSSIPAKRPKKDSNSLMGLIDDDNNMHLDQSHEEDCMQPTRTSSRKCSKEKQQTVGTTIGDAVQPNSVV